MFHSIPLDLIRSHWISLDLTPDLTLDLNLKLALGLAVSGYFCTAFDASFGAGVALLVLTPLGSLGLIYKYIQRKERASRTNQREVIIALSSQFSTLAQPEEILGRAFECFDREEPGLTYIHTYMHTYIHTYMHTYML